LIYSQTFSGKLSGFLFFKEEPMKTITSIALVSVLLLSGLALASQSGEQKDHSSMMEEMMKGGKDGEHKDEMMRMIKMMDQCAAMMQSAKEPAGVKESQKQ